MANISGLKAQVGQIESIKEITQAMADIATSQIKQRRAVAERNIQYFREIFTLYETVKQIALKTKRYQETQRAKNGKTAVILLTSNNKFNGDLDVTLTNFFIEQSSLEADPGLIGAEKLVVGVSGQELLRGKHVNFKYTPIKFAKDYPTVTEIDSLVKQVGDYSRVLVYHSRFITLLNQEPAMTDITATEELKSSVKPENIQFLLEPEIGKMIAFFEDQMLLLLLQSIFLESEIARTAARMISMNQAEQAAEKMLESQKKSLFHGRKALANMKIVENFAASYASGGASS